LIRTVVQLLRKLKRGPSLGVLNAGVGSLDEQLFYDAKIAPPHGLVERCLAPNVLAINLSVLLGEEVAHTDG